MFGVFGRKGPLARRKIEPGDGHKLKPYRFWHLVGRALFYAVFHLPDGVRRTYAVDVNYFDGEMKTDLYLNGRHCARAALPAVFPVEGGQIEVATSTYGLKRMHFVDRAGRERVLQPDRRSAEGRRARLTAQAPKLSRGIGITAVVILVVLLPSGLLQVAEMLSHAEFAQRHVDPFTSPITLPAWASTTTLILGALAGFERALTLRNHWLIDMDTGWFDG